MVNFFQFETDFVDSLRCIPMEVRMKLDTCGVKLKLVHWHQFSQEERQALVNLPCRNSTESQAYRKFVQNLVGSKTGTPAKELAIDPYPPWMDNKIVSAHIQAKAAEFGVTITKRQWENLSPLQRFALIKLSRPGHENRNFLPALKEFNLIARS